MIKIRPYRVGDLDAVKALHLIALQQIGADAGPGPWDQDLEHIEAEYTNLGGEFLIGEVDGVIVAMGALRKMDECSAEIKRMRVHPNFQRHGFGQILLDSLETVARHKGFTRLVLDTTVRQVAAQALYRKNGYQETQRKHDGRIGMVYMEKHLNYQSVKTDTKKV